MGRNDGSIAYSHGVADHSVEPTVGSVGDSFASAPAETVNRLYKAELMYAQSWRSLAEDESATLNWIR